jgi:hypothetical protein
MSEPERRNPRDTMVERQQFHSKGWQVANIDEQMVLERNAFVPLTEHDESAVILNCYQPGQHDEMHAHPKEEHVFLVWKGKLHLTGVETGEDLVYWAPASSSTSTRTTTIGSTTRGRSRPSTPSSARCPRSRRSGASSSSRSRPAASAQRPRRRERRRRSLPRPSYWKRSDEPNRSSSLAHCHPEEPMALWAAPNG